MANKSKIRRERMLKFLEDLREQNKNDDQILIAINEIQNEITNEKYGLVWEEHDENIELLLKDNIPVFIDDKDREIALKKDKRFNFIIEGDNLHSLYLMKKTHKDSIDVIYIDPPYNTENSLTYDDKRVGADDLFRHSKWLSFMEPRLIKSRELLKNNGIIFVSIDDNEAFQLKVLMDEIYGEHNCMGVFAVIKAEGGGMAKYIVKGHDLLLVYAKDLLKTHPLAKEKDIRGKRITINHVEYWIQEDAIRETFGQYGNLYYEDVLKNRGQEFLDQINEGIRNNEYILVPKNNGKTIIGKLRRIDEDYSKFYSVLKHLNADGFNTLKTMGLEDDFDYPKPISLIKEIIKGATFFSKGPITILDFFAGSGTTGQAVLELNKEDGKDRTFILCTNNEVSAKAKLKFMKEFGYLKDFTPSPQASESSIESKIYSCFENGEVEFKKMIEDNKKLYESFGICQAVTEKRIRKVIEGYVSKVGDEVILYEKKLSVDNLKNAAEYTKEIEDIINKNEYEKYNKKITSDQKIQLFGVSNAKHKYDGIEANLKYYKTGFVSKDVEFLSDALLEHIKEMIQLEHGINVDEKNYLIILDEDQADEVEKDWLKYTELKGIYISRNVLLSTSQNVKFSKVEMFIIPDYYFDFELKEVGETW
jgi:adenine-specific DNA-methyltransferase